MLIEKITREDAIRLFGFDTKTSPINIYKLNTPKPTEEMKTLDSRNFRPAGYTINDKQHTLGKALGSGAGIGGGAKSTTYAVTDDIVCKVILANILPESGPKQVATELLSHEISALQKANKLPTKAMIQYYNLDGMSYVQATIPMRRAKGVTLTNHFPALDSENITAHRIFSLCAAIAKALAEFHQHDLVHRDLHSENVMIDFNHQTQQYKAEVIDFGLVRPNQFNPKNDFTQGLHIATEATKKGHRCDFSQDLFSLGRILAKILCGKENTNKAWGKRDGFLNFDPVNFEKLPDDSNRFRACVPKDFHFTCEIILKNLLSECASKRKSASKIAAEFQSLANYTKPTKTKSTQQIATIKPRTTKTMLSTLFEYAEKDLQALETGIAANFNLERGFRP